MRHRWRSRSRTLERWAPATAHDRLGVVRGHHDVVDAQLEHAIAVGLDLSDVGSTEQHGRRPSPRFPAARPLPPPPYRPPPLSEGRTADRGRGRRPSPIRGTSGPRGDLPSAREKRDAREALRPDGRWRGTRSRSRDAPTRKLPARAQRARTPSRSPRVL
jgi:hypothetical protein